MRRGAPGGLLWSAVLTSASLVCIGVTQLAFNVAVGRSLGAAALGEVTLAMSVSLLASTLLSASFVPAGSKFVPEHLGREDEEGARAAYTLSLLVVVVGGLGLALALYAAAARVASWAGASPYQLALALPLVVLHPLYLLMKGMYYATDRVGEYLGLEAASSAIFFLALAASVWSGRLLPLPFVAAYLAFSAVALVRWRGFLRLGGEAWRRVVAPLSSFALWCAAGQVSMMAKIRLSVIVAASSLAMDQVGLYSAAYALQSVFYFVPKSLNMVIAPAVSFSFGSGDRARVSRIHEEATRHISLVIVPLGGACILAAPLILTALYSSAFAGAAGAFRLLVLATLSTVIAMPATNSLTSTEHVGVTGTAGFVGLAAALAVWAAALPARGIGGLALGFFAGSLANAALTVAFAWLRLGLSPRPMYRPIATGAAAAAAGYAASGGSAAGQLAGALVLCAVYVAANLAELSELVGRLAAVVRARRAPPRA